MRGARMGQMDAIKTEYFRMRDSGLDAKVVLTQLRPEIVRLDVKQREQLLEQLRIWEISNAAASVKAKNAPPTGVPIKPLHRSQHPKSSHDSAVPVPAPSEPTQVMCPHCDRMNRADDVFCYSCGQLLTMERGLFDTRNFSDAADEFRSDEFFGADTTLILLVKDTQDTVKFRPQDRRHEIIVGRIAGGTMKPDIDLSAHRAGELGVSRLHVSMTYNEKHRTLSASDLGSANGTFINGQRLHPEEVRVLRHGDELRLGKLVLIIYFQHQRSENGASTSR